MALAGIVIVVACWVIAFLLPSPTLQIAYYPGPFGTVFAGAVETSVVPSYVRSGLIVGGTVIGAQRCR